MNKKDDADLILRFFEGNDLPIPSTVDEAVTLVSDNSILSKRLIKTLFFVQLKGKIPDLELYESIDKHFPRDVRYQIVSSLEDELAVSFPKMHLSWWRMKRLYLCFGVPIAAIIFLMLYDVRFFILAFSATGLLLYLIAITIPSIVVSLFDRTFFMPYDWKNISTVSDLLTDMAVDNYSWFVDNECYQLKAFLAKYFR